MIVAALEVQKPVMRPTQIGQDAAYISRLMPAGIMAVQEYISISQVVPMIDYVRQIYHCFIAFIERNKIFRVVLSEAIVVYLKSVFVAIRP
jgi:hypothetical protein